MFELKPGVSLKGIKPEMAAALPAIAQVISEASVTPVITSCTDGQHGRNSRHYVGLATDWRNRDIKKAMRPLVAQAIRDALGPEFNVLEEDTHFHIAFKP